MSIHNRQPNVTIDQLVPRLNKARRGSNGWTACCPAHNDSNPSLSIATGSDGRILLHCHRGCEPANIRRALGITLAQLFPDSPTQPTRTANPALPATAGSNWRDIAERQAVQLSPKRRTDLAEVLHLPVWATEALPLLGSGRDTEGDKCEFWSFPEYDGSGAVIGISRRYRRGDKKAMKRSKRGLTLAALWRPRALERNLVLVVEGGSDVLACAAAGLPVVGRPSATGGVNYLADLFHDLTTEVRILVVGENDKKPDGSWPGQEGAIRTARNLSEKLHRPIEAVLPPEDSKDSRAFLTARAKPTDTREFWAVQGNEYLTLLLANVLIVECQAGEITSPQPESPPDPPEPEEPAKPDPSIPTDPGPFPEQLLEVPGFVGEVMGYTLATAHRRQPLIALAGALALLGVLTGRKVCDELNTRTNLYVLGIVPSGGGKDRPREVNKEILAAANAIPMGKETIASAAGLVSAVDQQPASLFQIDEFGRYLKTMADPRSAPHLAGIITKLMTLYSSAGTHFSGDTYADVRMNKTIEQPHVCLLGSSVPRSFYESLTTENVTDGFLSRTLIFEVDGVPPKERRSKRPPLPASIAEQAQWWVSYQPGGNLSGEYPRPRTVETIDEARQILDQFDDEAEEYRRVLGDPYGSLWTRAGEKANKLALLYACSRDAQQPIIDAPAACWACELSRYLTRRMAFLASQRVADGEYDAKRLCILRVIREAGGGGIDRATLTRRTQFIKKRERDEILEAQQEAEDIVLQNVTTRGRPRQVFVSRR
jgi:hypothetical protein